MKRRKGSKVHLAVETLGQVLALLVTKASEQDRAQVAELAAQVQAMTGHTVEEAFELATSTHCDQSRRMREIANEQSHKVREYLPSMYYKKS